VVLLEPLCFRIFDDLILGGILAISLICLARSGELPSTLQGGGCRVDLIIALTQALMPDPPDCEVK
jgi:hypothetical protein